MIWWFHELLRPAFWFQPCFYAFHGWLATEMAIWLLFHPYEAKYIPGTRVQIPLTPGIFPRGRANLAHSIADTVTSTLLTEADLHRQTEKLITEDNIERCIEGLLNSIEREVQNTEQIRHIYRYGEEVIPALLNQLVNGLIDNLETSKAGKLQPFVSELLKQALPSARLNYHQAEYVVNVLFNTLLTPYYLRQVIAEGLTDPNIARIENGIADRVGGVKGLLVRFMGVDKSLIKLREFYTEHPDEAEVQITEVLDKLEVREKLAERISNFVFEELTPETQEAVLGYATGIFTETLGDHRQELTATIAQWSGKLSRMVINRLLQANLKQWLNEKRPDLKREMACFLHRYLHRELEALISYALPAIDIGQMILEKMEQFSNEELEGMIYGICRRELRWMAFLGAFLGFWLGLMSNFVNYWLQGIK